MGAIGGWHWNLKAYLWSDHTAWSALAVVLPPLPSLVQLLDGTPTLDGRRRQLMEVDVEDVILADVVRAEVAEDVIAAHMAFLREHADAIERSPTSEDEEFVRARCLAWLSRQIAGPVGYWLHHGRDGLNDEYFLGFGEPSHPGAPLTYWNDDESKPDGWDDTLPRSAKTAALWHVGVATRNLDESAWLHRQFGF